MIGIIAIIAVTVVAAGFVLLSFSNGYKIPQRGKHKDWPEFPAGSNPDVVIAPVDSLYINSIERIGGTPYFTSSSPVTVLNSTGIAVV
jgi:hypothetical protein